MISSPGVTDNRSAPLWIGFESGLFHSFLGRFESTRMICHATYFIIICATALLLLSLYLSFQVSYHSCFYVLI